MTYQLSFFDSLLENNHAQNIITPFITDGNVNISPEEWSVIRQNNTQARIIDDFSEEILSGNIVLPLRQISYRDMVDSFYELLAYECNDYQYGPVYSRYEYKYKMLDKYISESNVGNIASDYFHQENRFKCGSVNSPSPARTWSNRIFLRGALKSLFTMNHQQINMSTLRTCLCLRKYVASQFKPAVAKSVYEKFGSRYVLDFSSGWGDRLCGFYAAKNTAHYVGIDPNSSLTHGYENQIAEYGKHVEGKSASMICMPAEEVRLEKASVDTVFTSPPYFNVERYSDDDTQSYKRYKGIDKWLSGFLFPAVENAWNALQNGGNMVVNISDVYSGHRINKICDPMNDHIAHLGGEYVGCIGMKMSKRPNSKAAGHEGQTFIEPMWVWRKP